MSSRQRLLAVYRGLPVDRLPFWAKVTNRNWRLGQPQRVRDWSDPQLLDFIHADGIFTVPRFASTASPHVRLETTQNGYVRTTVIHTPDGNLISRWNMDPHTQSWHPIEFPVKTRQDLLRYRWVWTDPVIQTDAQLLARAQAVAHELGDRGLTKMAWGTSPLMHLVEHVIGLEQTAYLLADYPNQVDELLERMHAANATLVTHLAQRSPADVICSIENTSTTLISPQQFQRYCYRHLCQYGRIIEHAGKMHELHMCGHLFALLPSIDSIPAASVEAFTSPPLGNTRLADGRRHAPAKTLVGGTNAVAWLKPLQQIQAYILAELDACPDHRRIVLTTAGEAPQGCPVETFRAIGQWISSLPVRM
jgi:hypothetical protein